MLKSNSLRLTESAIMLAFGTILSLIAIVQLPFGGSITAFSMLPIILIAYRYGTKWGLFTGLAFGLIEMLLGMNNLSYATSVQAVLAIIFLDYIAAFTVLGFAGFFRRIFSNQATALTAGTFSVCTLRYLCHVISGCTVWAGVSIPDTDGLIYSLAYNASYMIPETLVTIVGAVYVSRVLDFRCDTITRVSPREKAPDLAILLSGLSNVVLVFAAVFDIQHVFAKIQGESGFDITQISAVNWEFLLIVTAVCLIAATLLWLLGKKVPADNTTSLRTLFTYLPLLGVLAAAVFDVVFIIFSAMKGSIEPFGWIQFAILTLSVLVAAYFVIRRTLVKVRA